MAAAIGIALLGLAGIAGGWFEQRVTVAPSPSGPIVVTSASPTPSASQAPAPSLVSLDDLILPLNPDRVVRTYAVGPTGGPGDQIDADRTPIDGGSVMFAPLATPGTYHLWTVCLGDGSASVSVANPSIRGNTRGPNDEPIAIACDGVVRSRDVKLASGDVLRVDAPPGAGWRLALEAMAPVVRNAQVVASVESTNPEANVVGRARSVTAVPSYDELQTGGGIQVQAEVASVPQRDGYGIAVSCAGPTNIRYALGYTVHDGPVPDGTVIEYAASEVTCDGRLHRDSFDIALESGATVYVTAEDRVAWELAVFGEKAPIAIEPDGNGWQMSIATGPDLDFDGTPSGLTGMVQGTGRDINVVVTCFGGTKVDVDVHSVSEENAPLVSFTVPCDADGSMSIGTPVHLPSEAFKVVVDPEGKMWIAVTVQERTDGKPYP